MQYVCKTSTSFPSIWMQNGMLINLSQLKSSHHVVHYPASSSSSNSRAPDSWLKGRGFESLLEWQENFFSRVSFLCWLLFRYLFHRVTTVARKRSQSFCRWKCRWQITAKHPTYVALHEMTWCMVVWCTQNAPRWQQFHVAPAMSALLTTPLQCIFKNTLWKASHSYRITCQCSVWE